MKKTNIAYWITTGIFAFLMLGSAIPDIMVHPVAVKGFADMNFPAYMIPFLGVAKLLGVIAILVPGFPRIKEWAYAGLIFDLIGATYCVMMSVAGVTNWAPMLLFIVIGAMSYSFYHKRQKATADNTRLAVVNPG